MTALVNAGRVPARLQETLSSGVNALVAETPTCLPPVETAAPQGGGDEGHGNGKGHEKHGHGKHGEGD